MATTFTAINDIVLSSTTTTVTFSSIPQTYTDLVLIFTGKQNGGTDNLRVYYNSDNGNTGVTYTAVRMLGSGTTLGASERQYAVPYAMAGDIGTSWFSGVLNFQDYSNTSYVKYFLGHSGDTTYQGIYAGRWDTGNAITDISLRRSTGLWQVGSSFQLFGIKAA